MGVRVEDSVRRGVVDNGVVTHVRGDVQVDGVARGGATTEELKTTEEPRSE